MTDRDPDFAEALQLALDDWEQGDILSIDSACVLRDTACPLTGDPISDGPLAAVFVELLDGRAMVVSQTCDIVDSDPLDKPTILIAPIRELAPDKAGLARKGRMPRFVGAEWAGSGVFADLSGIFPVEKSLIAVRTKLASPQSARDRTNVAQRIARHFERFAFPDDFQPATASLRERFRIKAPMEDLVREVRALPVGDDWTHDPLDVHLLFLADTNDDIAQKSEAEWNDAVDGWINLCRSQGQIRSFDAEYLSLEALTASEYLRSARLDIEAQS